MTCYADLKIIAEDRLDDAKALYQARRYDGTAYLCGYVLEVALKARICKLLELDEYPCTGVFKQAFATHDLSVLLKLAGLEKEISLSKSKNYNLFIQWSMMISWNWDPEMRYRIMNKNKKEVGNMLVVLINIFKWLKNYW
ncbi:MAG: hypothetical protein A2402_02450 [Candidatus Staskawiczbacteria bacterium RIFOXYC1_FULL_37_43]|nr:MAG: hypothetical protein A2813_02370 [Candidatus Staskawiczbacteria bacterium RIFCSPHIGHO2_01_FULL_37_17]OGZ72487.1 MAG: hypothetical protein A2891_00290 [Candidatus Staskawiczbacteria bacterium RIFCSPLOWO2_01_FULL_37_19]OGZ75660.1 MAG: hypothetical protein A2205_00530 [Candidatus Staskawiczbacteria bacterium RIFOXYA1_FULL_37_15]OGZ77424.1 MAG: hypothetical protein A2280_02735 [Candidatus Staskawiczbacteria bacterium RIFOXYA12_FULL_37_10]OGZ79937.1 MAG: hypothetical protein A2353_01770 [Can